MQYFRSPGRRPSRNAANELLVDRLGDPAGINARLAFASAGEAHCDVYPTGPGLQGLSFPMAVKAGALHTACFKILPGSAPRLRLEVHGRATRMQKAVATIGADGSIVS